MNLPTYMSGVLFTRAHKLVRNRVQEVLGRHNLSLTHWSILGATTRAPEGIRLANVAAVLGVKAPMVTTEAGALIERGLIRRIPHHTDKRAKLLVITPDGKKLATDVEIELNRAIGHLLDGLTSAEIANFQKSLETIIDNAKKKY